MQQNKINPKSRSSIICLKINIRKGHQRRDDITGVIISSLDELGLFLTRQLFPGFEVFTACIIIITYASCLPLFLIQLDVLKYCIIISAYG